MKNLDVLFYKQLSCYGIRLKNDQKIINCLAISQPQFSEFAGYGGLFLREG